MNGSPARTIVRAVWITLLVGALAGIGWKAFRSEGGVARTYVEIKSFERVLAEPTQPADGDTPASPAWVASDDPRLADGTLKPVAGREPIAWKEETLVARKDYRQWVEEGSPGGRVIERSTADEIGVWIAALLTLGILSFLYRDNPVYKVAESLLVGVSAGYWMVFYFWSVLVPKLFAPLAPDIVRALAMPELQVSTTPGSDMLIALVPLTLGVLMLCRILPRVGWIAVWPLAFIIGTTAGLRLISSVEADLLPQALDTMKPLLVFNSGADAQGNPTSSLDLLASISSIVGVLGVLSVLSYFFFSFEHKGAFGASARVGIWFLMVTLGSAFGLTVMGRITLLSQRFEFLFKDWLDLIQ
ncbi:MAG: hypothetical protein ACKO0W_13270 [Planctomycetota bacterium]